MCRMATTGQEEPATVRLPVKLAIFTVVVPGAVTTWLPLFLLYPEIRRRPLVIGGHTFVGLAAMAIGAAGYFWCALDFVIAGKGTPAPIDMPKVLVVGGLYRFQRNPMYTSVLLVLAGESVLFWSLRLVEYAALIAVCFHLWVLMHEEPTLRRKMGAAYDRYRRDVPRWIPRRKPNRRSNAV